ncbi:MAG: Tad secretion system assembly platform protein TadC [Saliniramus fredricksonii]|uniref:Tad secretion system assembly platform protein TadC n=1 Tax=Saliniramus fredricksonii TaxID=1653334 RepID=A0A0P8ABX8_9HYPH|nr:type II secretion system F family protein [Saliniramus fredricksonii]KPQ12782.1 MAG: Tad secretion system assembly platform protein TadC [Saliniramus fredricksonii]SCC82543.1 tight adherence protein C [Saliniramus fredricksonii]
MIMQALSDPQFLAMVLAGIAAVATVFTVAMPLIANDNLDKRMKAVAVERDRIRARERERLTRQNRGSLRSRPAERIRQFVEQFKLSDWLGTETAKMQLMQAGFRGQKSEYTFLVFRLVLPISFTLIAGAYLYFIDDFELSLIIQLGIVIFAAYIGIKAPEIFLRNAMQKRQLSIRRAWPDALDLLLICAESGTSMEQAFRRVSTEIGRASIALAEELALTTAELSYLPERRQAYEHLAERTGLESVKAVSTALIQAERYGTPIGQALRVLAQESRDQRMNEAEKKAAALPPKLTVPMILFFLPVLFAVIMTPALIQVFDWQ